MLPPKRKQQRKADSMSHETQFYIDGNWVDPVTPNLLDVIDPSTEEAYTQISIGSKADVDLAVAAARRAFVTFSQTTRQERLDLLKRILAVFKTRYDDIAAAITQEMGAPKGFLLTHQPQPVSRVDMALAGYGVRPIRGAGSCLRGHSVD